MEKTKREKIMKTEQIELAIAIYEYGSITKAAKKLFIAQPNASSSIYSLEQELGFRIFDRTHNGVQVTDKGEKFLEYAYSIQRNIENIHSLKNANEKIHLFVATYAYPFSENAFVKFCEKYVNFAESSNCSLRRIGTVYEGIEMLLNNSVDVSVIVCSRELYGQFLKKFKQKSLVPVILGYTALYITLSEKHPLTKKESTNLVDFTDYPCLSNFGISMNCVPAKIESLLNEVHLHIVMEPGDSRLTLLENSDSFSISTPYPKELLKRHHLINREIPETDRAIVLLTRAEDQNNKQILNYVELVKKEMPEWFSKI